MRRSRTATRTIPRSPAGVGPRAGSPRRRSPGSASRSSASAVGRVPAGPATVGGPLGSPSAASLSSPEVVAPPAASRGGDVSRGAARGCRAAGGGRARSAVPVGVTVDVALGVLVGVALPGVPACARTPELVGSTDAPAAGHERAVGRRQRHERGGVRGVDVRQRAAHVVAAADGEIPDRSRRREDHAHVRRQALDPLIVGQRGDAVAQQLVLAGERRRLLEGATHVRPELQDLHLRGDDPRQQHAEQRDPGPTADDPVEQRVVGGRTPRTRRSRAGCRSPACLFPGRVSVAGLGAGAGFGARRGTVSRLMNGRRSGSATAAATAAPPLAKTPRETRADRVSRGARWRLGGWHPPGRHSLPLCRSGTGVADALGRDPALRRRPPGGPRGAALPGVSRTVRDARGDPPSGRRRRPAGRGCGRPASAHQASLAVALQLADGTQMG